MDRLPASSVFLMPRRKFRLRLQPEGIVEKERKGRGRERGRDRERRRERKKYSREGGKTVEGRRETE